MKHRAEDRLPPFAELVLAASEGLLQTEADWAVGAQCIVERLRVETPWEIELGARGERLELGSSPPTQTVQTSVMPVWHRLAVTVRLDHGRDRD